ncbi:hypothetical protein XO08_08150 [Thermosipho sp. 1074]|nr:hypothetical protein XO08_08150 [Thermosipho sp. 1074]
MWATKKEEYKIRFLKSLIIFLFGIYFGALAFIGINYYFQRTNFLTFSIDELKGKKIEDIEKDLSSSGFKVEFFNKGQIVDVIPKFSVLKKGRTIKIILRDEKFKLPNLYGVFYLEGISFLKKREFDVEIVKIKFPGPDGRILASYPSFGSEISKNSKIRLLVDFGETGGME